MPALALIAGLFALAAGAGALSASGDTLEKTVAADPEDLRAAAAYRQIAIASGEFDRSIEFFERLAKRSGSGPNIYISLALAYVDKVPASGDMRRLYLGRDAMMAATKSIERRASVLAYYIRGVVNLYYNGFIFHRIPRGIADLQQAAALIAPATPAVLGARVYVSLGDGYWRLEKRETARDAWRRGLDRYPSDPMLQGRVWSNDRDVENLVSDALYAGNRVDTSLRGVVP